MTDEILFPKPIEHSLNNASNGLVTLTGEPDSRYVLDAISVDQVNGGKLDYSRWGATSMVLIAEDSKQGGRVAIKVYEPASFNEIPERAAFVREADKLEDHSHPNLPRLLEDIQLRRDGVLYPAFVLEYLDPLDLEMSIDEIGQMVTDIAAALDYLHTCPNSIVHIDVKKDNIRVRLTEERKVYVLTDLGSALTADERKGSEYPLAPTGLYADQDISRLLKSLVTSLPGGVPLKNQDYVEKADQYSLALTAFEVLMGRTLTEQEVNDVPHTLQDLDRLPVEVYKVFLRALIEVRQLRYDSCGDFAVAFNKAIKSLSPIELKATLLTIKQERDLMKKI